MKMCSRAVQKPNTSAPYTSHEKKGASGLNVPRRHARYQTLTMMKAPTRRRRGSSSVVNGTLFFMVRPKTGLQRALTSGAFVRT